jgi:hypothetical protein
MLRILAADLVSIWWWWWVGKKPKNSPRDGFEMCLSCIGIVSDIEGKKKQRVLKENKFLLRGEE